MKSQMYVLIICGLFGCAQTVRSDDLTVVEDTNLVQLLNNLELVVERLEIPLRLRVYRLRELGECDGPPARCPKEVLYVAVSTYDEAPDQKLYVLPESYGWQFSKWSSWPSSDDMSQYAAFEVVSKRLAPNGGESIFSTEKYDVRVNVHNGIITPDGTEPKERAPEM